MTDQEYSNYLKSEQWKEKAAKRLEIDRYTCQGCGSRGSSDNPLQVHHLNYKHVGNEDVYTDLVCLCRNCHIRTHHIMNRVTDKLGHRGWNDNSQVPRIHVFTVGGLDINRIED